MKACNTCLLQQPLDAFDLQDGRWRRNTCKKCRQQTRRLAKYNLSQSAFLNLQLQSNGQCKICNRINQDLVIDHNHKTGAVRSLLCKECNLILGKIEADYSSPEIIINNILEYLKK